MVRATRRRRPKKRKTVKKCVCKMAKLTKLKLTETEKIAACFCRLAYSFRRLQLLDIIRYMTDIIYNRVPMPFSPGCMCREHVDWYICSPALCYLEMCREIKMDAIGRDINPAHVYINNIAVYMRRPFDTKPIEIDIHYILDARDINPERRIVELHTSM